MPERGGEKVNRPHDKGGTYPDPPSPKPLNMEPTKSPIKKI